MPKILYVEDNDDNVFVMRGRLPRAGFGVIVSLDGEQGVVMAETEEPDLILMDFGCRVSTAGSPCAASRRRPDQGHPHHRAVRPCHGRRPRSPRGRVRRLRHQAGRLAQAPGKDRDHPATVRKP